MSAGQVDFPRKILREAENESPRVSVVVEDRGLADVAPHITRSLLRLRWSRWTRDRKSVSIRRPTRPVSRLGKAGEFPDAPTRQWPWNRSPGTPDISKAKRNARTNPFP